MWYMFQHHENRELFYRQIPRRLLLEMCMWTHSFAMAPLWPRYDPSGIRLYDRFQLYNAHFEFLN